MVKENALSEKLPAQIQERDQKRKTSLQQRVVKKIENLDTKGAMRIISSNDTVADVTFENHEKLLAMHPTPSREMHMPDPPNEALDCLQVNEN